MRGGVAEQLLQGDLSGGVVEQIRASDDMGDALCCVVGNHGQLVGTKRPASSDYKITDSMADVFCDASVHKIFKHYVFIINDNAKCAVVFCVF